ncbi:hypothetical protein QJQ45_012423 [Haematococcus lacustris]|nr:hypothetical protein QJQ45_012423 [Haematococcus lacustris]
MDSSQAGLSTAQSVPEHSHTTVASQAEPQVAMRLLYSNFDAGIIIGVLDAVAATCSLLEAVDDPSGGPSDRASSSSARPGCSRQVRLLLPAATCGAVIGRGGETIRRISQETSTNISLTPQDHQGGLNYHRAVTITGSEAVAALGHIISRVLESAPARQHGTDQGPPAAVLPITRPRGQQPPLPYDAATADFLLGFMAPHSSLSPAPPWPLPMPALAPRELLSSQIQQQQHMLQMGQQQLQLWPQQQVGLGLPYPPPDLHNTAEAGLAAYNMQDLQHALDGAQHTQQGTLPGMASVGHLPSSTSLQQQLSGLSQQHFPGLLPPTLPAGHAQPTTLQPFNPAHLASAASLTHSAPAGSLQLTQQQQQAGVGVGGPGQPSGLARPSALLTRHTSLGSPRALQPRSSWEAVQVQQAAHISPGQASELMTQGMGWLQSLQNLLQVRVVVLPEEGRPEEQAPGQLGYKVVVSGRADNVELALQYLAQRFLAHRTQPALLAGPALQPAPS